MDNQTMDSQELQDLANLKQLHKGKGIAATICGIVSLIGCLGPISFICGIVAIFVGANARKKSNKTTGTAGMVMGIIGVVISIISTILIIAMMAGIMAPQLGNYMDKTEIANDTQLCDTVRTAIVTCMMDPSVITDEEAADFINYYCDGYYYDISVMFYEDNKFTESFQDILDVDSYSELCDKLESDGAYTIEFCADYNEVYVRIPGTDIEVN
ncbi:MAG: DUF4190 domain-containing protein [Lachnospiraceae bacterium]|nr:DUF4190 domain-containing protein [Lachnospiraceae bacterium]MBQ7834025.1 DUF4190 domain-containing protein [Lachnospiraceae bacterium]